MQIRMASLFLMLVIACGDDDGGAVDAGAMDAGPRDAAGGVDGGGVETDAGTEDGGAPPDAGGGGEACVAYATALSDGLSMTLGTAVAACGRGPCLACALDGGSGTMCGPGGTMTSCVLDCIAANDWGSCPADAPCDGGQTCDADANVCRNDAVTAVNDAIAGGDLDLACTGCYAGTSGCVVGGGCAIPCASPGCSCDTCQCDNGCPGAFAACSGLDPYLDCAMVMASCG